MHHYKNEIVSINGTQYRNLDKCFYEQCSVGDDVLLVREPGNPHDINAVAVIYRGEQIGYIPRREAGTRLAYILDSGRGYKAELTQVTPWKKRDIFRIKISTFTKTVQKPVFRGTTHHQRKPRATAFYTQNHSTAIKETKSKCGIYRIVCKNGKSYVGQSKQIGIRWQEHIQELRRGFHSNTSLNNDWAKLGARLFRFEVLEECLPEQLDQREKYYIEQENSYFSGYNATIDGQGISDFEQCNIPFNLLQEVRQTKSLRVEKTIINTGENPVESYHADKNMVSTTLNIDNKISEHPIKKTTQTANEVKVNSLRSQLRAQEKSSRLTARPTILIHSDNITSEPSKTGKGVSQHTQCSHQQLYQKYSRLSARPTHTSLHFDNRPPKSSYSRQQYVNEVTKRFPDAEAIINSPEFNNWLNTASSIIKEKSKSLIPSDGIFVLRTFERHVSWKAEMLSQQRHKNSIFSRMKHSFKAFTKLFTV